MWEIEEEEEKGKGKENKGVRDMGRISKREKRGREMEEGNRKGEDKR